jgi:cell division protein FtsL
MTKKRKIKNILSALPVAVIILTGFYIFQIVQLTQYGYDINAKEGQITTLKQQNADLQLSLSQGKNLLNFEDKIIQEGYNKVDKIDYLTIPSDSVASK